MVVEGIGFETRLVNGVRIAGHHGSLAGSSNQVEFYPDLGYVMVVPANTDSGTEAIATHVCGLLISSPRYPYQMIAWHIRVAVLATV
jgi:hypothetical protein